MKLRTRVAYKLLSPATWDLVRQDWALATRRRTNASGSVRRALADLSDASMHFGCGARATPGWINIDAFDQPGLTIRWDVRDRLPCPDGVAKRIYTEHMLEHLEFDDAQRFIRELYRLLASGGRIRIGVPDAGRYLRAYSCNDRQFFETLSHIGSPVQPLDTPIKVINQMFRMGGAHRFAWDFETLAAELQTAGFTAIRQCESGQGADAELLLDDPSHAAETLYIEAERPPSSHP